ncbi:MAG: conjugal transfer protein TraN [Pseudomonadota bacterium]|nr:conjugal transfer protein TraN [Pseudomonadota bacterium]MDP2352685.1 conjugal transfer protein TraN [Pseudomonadota bacterium]
MKFAFCLLAALLGVMAAIAQASDCTKTGSVCVEGPESRNISGLSVTRDCWRYQDTYLCVDPDMTSDCQELRDRGCGQIGTQCIEIADDGACVLSENTYQCQTSPATTRQVEDCSPRLFCANGECFDTGFEPDADFGKAVAAMESAREAGTYIDPDTLRLFTGAASKCTKKLGGLANCCKKGSSGGGGMSNQSIAMNMVGDLASQTASYGYSVGSAYTYDAMFSSDMPWMMNKSIDAWQAGTWTGSAGPFNPSLSYMGLSVSLTGAAPAVSSTLANVFGTWAATPMQIGMSPVYFTPATFYIAIAMMVIQELISCDPEDQQTAMRAGQNLCVSLGSYCSSKFLKICLEKKEGYCCFNSRLARIIQEQGRAQLGKTWGSAKSPECSGFTTAEFESLDFSRIDLTEFIREVQPKAMDVQALAERMNSRVQTMANQ